MCSSRQRGRTHFNRFGLPLRDYATEVFEALTQSEKENVVLGTPCTPERIVLVGMVMKEMMCSYGSQAEKSAAQVCVVLATEGATMFSSCNCCCMNSVLRCLSSSVLHGTMLRKGVLCTVESGKNVTFF